MKDSRNADVEVALGAGAATAALMETGVIASGGAITGLVAEVGTFSGMTVFANMGAGAATLCGALGPIGWAAAGIGGAALIIHGLYRGS